MTETTPGVNPSGESGPGAVVLDVDGTLLDTVYLHVLAWWESFLACGHEVSCFDIHRAIGRSAPELVETLLGQTDDDVVTGHAERWAPLRDRCLPFHRVPELIRTCSERGLQVVYATSGDEQDSAAFRQKIDCDDVVDAVVSSADVEHGKPAPDIVRAALAAVGAAPERAVVLGDSVWDVLAATAAGVPCIGVTCGGLSEQELREAGAREVYGNPSELLAAFDDSLLGRLVAGAPATRQSSVTSG